MYLGRVPCLFVFLWVTWDPAEAGTTSVGSCWGNRTRPKWPTPGLWLLTIFGTVNTRSRLSSKCCVALLKLKCINTVCFQNLGQCKTGWNSVSQSFREGNCSYVNWILTRVLGTRQNLALLSPQPYEVGLATSIVLEKRYSRWRKNVCGQGHRGKNGGVWMWAWEECM